MILDERDNISVLLFRPVMYYVYPLTGRLFQQYFSELYLCSLIEEMENQDSTKSMSSIFKRKAKPSDVNL